MALLTDTKIRKAKPTEKSFKLYDTDGLFVLVMSSGAKYWRYRYTHSGKEKLLAIGVYPEVTLAEARQARDEARKIVKQGKDPVQSRKQQRQQEKIASANTFEVVAREWHEKQKHLWVKDHAARILKSLEDDAFPAIGKRPISEISAPELLNALRKIEKRQALETAQRILQRCGAVFRYGIASGLCERSPAADLRGALQVPKQNHYAYLRAEELPEFLRKLDESKEHRITKTALKLMLLTFVRTRELRGAKWTEFDLENAIWRIPAERMKMGIEHIVPLSKQAIQLITELRNITGSYPLLFPSQNKCANPISENTMLFAVYRMGYYRRTTVHGFRSTASTILNEQGFPSDAIERQLAHSESNKVRAAYNKAEYLPIRKGMMQAWADYLDAAKQMSFDNSEVLSYAA